MEVRPKITLIRVNPSKSELFKVKPELDCGFGVQGKTDWSRSVKVSRGESLTCFGEPSG